MGADELYVDDTVSPRIWLIRKVQRNAEGLIQGFELVQWEWADKAGQGLLGQAHQFIAVNTAIVLEAFI